MLNSTPDELLFHIGGFLPIRTLLNLAQSSKRYRRVLKRFSDSRRYETVTVHFWSPRNPSEDEDEDDDPRKKAIGTICDSMTLFNESELFDLVRKYAKTIHPIFSWEYVPFGNVFRDFDGHCKSVFELSLTLRNSKVERFDTFKADILESVDPSDIDLIGFGFPKSDRTFLNKLRGRLDYVNAQEYPRDHCALMPVVIGPEPLDQQLEKELLEFISESDFDGFWYKIDLCPVSENGILDKIQQFGQERKLAHKFCITVDGVGFWGKLSP